MTILNLFTWYFNLTLNINLQFKLIKMKYSLAYFKIQSSIKPWITQTVITIIYSLIYKYKNLRIVKKILYLVWLYINMFYESLKFFYVEVILKVSI